MSVVVNPGSVPRRLIAEARPSARCEVRPGRREIDSAMLVSGSLPMSSAEIASTMLDDSRHSTRAPDADVDVPEFPSLFLLAGPPPRPAPRQW
jgi:hypothetical protein